MSVQISTLANGLRVVSHEMPHLESASLGVWVGSGARGETAELNGVSHFLEHMAFKGTRTRSAQQIAEEIEAVGGDINAATSLESTAYFVRVLKDDVALGVELLADILQNSTFANDEIVRERDVILQEIAAVEDMPDDVVHECAMSVSFPDQPVGRPILGDFETVQNIDKAALTAHIAENYRAGDMILSAAGRIDHGALVDWAGERFCTLPLGYRPVPEPASYVGGGREVNRDCEQTQVILAFEGPSYIDDRFIASQILSGILGGGLSSRLFQEVREKRGLCYSIYSYASALSDSGIFGIHAGTSGELVPLLESVVVEQLIDLADRGPSEMELARSKAQLRAGLAMVLEGSGARAEQMARHLLTHGRVFAIDELVARVDDVSRDQISKLTQEIVRSNNPTWVQLGNCPNGHSQENLVARLNAA